MDNNYHINNQLQLLFAGAIFQVHYNRNYLRRTRRQLRDTLNPFNVPEFQFMQIYRLDKACVHTLIDNLEPHVNDSGSIPSHIKVLATLNFLATGSFQNATGCSMWHSLSQSSVSRAVNEICSVIVNHLYPVKIKFPVTLQEKFLVKQGFYEKWNVRGLVGLIDGTHIKLIAPPVTDMEHPHFVYINRKGKHSINLMLISDCENKIIACNARFPGSVHDAAIWQVSNIRQHLRENFATGDKTTHLYGDSGYPLEPWLFTPFAVVQEGSPEAQFNTQFNTVRNVIERTNGILKARFRCTSKQRILLYHPSVATKIIYTCCVLHNIATEAHLPIDEDEIYYNDNNNVNPDVIGQDVHNNILLQGRTARNEYVRENFD